MPIILITGANGHGKGQFAIREILRLQEENDKREKQGQSRRPIYANIHGVNEEGRTPLKDVLPIPEGKIWFGKQDNPDFPPPPDYFIPPIGSVFMYDECQRIDWIAQKSGALSSDLRVKSMEEHRHAGLDIYLITQSPNYIHSHIFDLVSPHYYCERALNLPQSNIFKYTKAQKSPQSSAIKAKADDHFFITLGKKYGQYYKSSAEHNMKTQIPKMLKVLIAVFVCLLLWTANSWHKAGWKIGNKQDDIKEQEIDNINIDETKSKEQVENQRVNETNNNQPKQPELTKEQLEKQLLLQKQQFDLELEKQRTQMLMQYTELQMQLLQQKKQIDDFYTRLELYKTMLPKNYEIIKNNPDLQVRAVVKAGNKCKAYNADGVLMTLTPEQCNYYVEQSGRVYKSNGGFTNVSEPRYPQSLTIQQDKMVVPKTENKGASNESVQ
ncbi:MAG: hypothetical protein D8B60_13470 [Moraxella sp.]|nr:MAG: hypothetical protein D8B60_13470 [Moraxella sp.]